MFSHIKVLELASVLAGPSVGQFFAELGAEVIKVENSLTSGDITRTWKSANEKTDDRSAYFCSVNWGKKSLAVDLTSNEGKSIVHKLASQSDIIIASYKPGDAEKLGVSYNQLANNNKRLIYGQVTGYGPDNDRVGYDAIIQAESGFMDLNGEINGSPTKMPVALIDVLAAHQLKEGLLLALYNRERSGVGDIVEVSLMDTALSSLTNQASNWLVGHIQPSRQGSLHPNIAPYGEIFKTADGESILLAIGSDRQFFDLCQLLDISKEAVQEKFGTNQKRVNARLELGELLKFKFAQHQSSDLLNQIHKKKIPVGIVRTVKEALDEPGIESIQLNADNLIGIRNFIGKMSNDVYRDKEKILPPPHFGEHTQEIITQLKA